MKVSMFLYSMTCTVAVLVNGPAHVVAQDRANAVPQGAKVIRDLQYAQVGDVRLSLDLYLPLQGDAPLPTIVAIHGGGWAAGRREEANGIRQASRGYAVAAISYRLSGVATFPAQIEDCKAAVRWLRANAKKYNLNPERVGATGHSAGGHLVSLLGTTGGSNKFDKGDHLEFSSQVQAVCALSGPTDFLQMDAHAIKDAPLKHDFPRSPESRLIGGPIQVHKEKVAQANPITYVSKNSPPFLLVHGDNDPLVPVHQAQLLYDALKNKGVEAKLYVVKGAGHGVGGPDVSQQIDRFFDTHLKKARPLASAPVLAQDRPPARPAGSQMPRLPETIRAELDLPYAGTDNPRQRLDLYLPKSPKSEKPLPLIIFIHGGAFMLGDRRPGPGDGGPSGLSLILSMVTRGEYAGASIGYRLSQEAIWPAQIHDCKAGIRWLRANAKKYGLDPDRIGVMGTSAGGHLAAMVGTSGGVAALEGNLGKHRDVSSKVTCAVDQFGPTDFLALYGGNNMSPGTPEAKLIGGALGAKPEAARSASPITYVAADNPPFLIIHGTNDPAVNIKQSERFFSALQTAGVNATFVRVIGGGHGGFPTPEVPKRIRLFFDKHLRGQDASVSAEPIKLEERGPSN